MRADSPPSPTNPFAFPLFLSGAMESLAPFFSELPSATLAAAASAWGTLSIAFGRIALILLSLSVFLLVRSLRHSSKRIAALERESRDAHPLNSLRRAATYPTTFPRGWYRLLGTDELKAGEIKQVDAFSTESFAIWRGEDGKVHVVDAFCPHLGANFAQGGRVR